MKNITTIIWATLILICPLSALSKLVVSIVTVPDDPHGYFKARTTGSMFDPDPNPCWGKGDICKLTVYTISELWLPGGKEGYATTDKGFKVVKQRIDIVQLARGGRKSLTNTR